jgi:uncharacterized protein
MNENIVEITKKFVQETLKDAEGGHDWFHIQRVLKLSEKIAVTEKCDVLVVQLGALLHDIADSKFHQGDETLGEKVAFNFLKTHNISLEIIEKVVFIINNISYKGGHNILNKITKELVIVQDADRLDAMGAIGISRTFNYGGFKNRSIYNPEIPPNIKQSKESYKNSEAPTINHFYEKLLLLKDKMNTQKGKELAQKRHDFMLKFLEEFYQEWGILD